MGHGKEFARLMQEFGGKTKEEDDDAEAEEDVTDAVVKKTTPAIDDAKNKSESVQRKGAGTGKLEGRLIVREKRTTGSVSWRGKGETECVDIGLSLTLTLSLHSLWRLPQGRQSILLGSHPHVVHARDAMQLDHEQLHPHLVASKVSPMT